jgi:hypothetical protein
MTTTHDSATTTSHTGDHSTTTTTTHDGGDMTSGHDAGD